MELKAWFGLKSPEPPKPLQKEKTVQSQKSPVDYWKSRQRQNYYQHVYALALFVGRDARSVIDVGSNGCPYLEWFESIPRRLSVDLRNPYRSETVEGIASDFLKFQAPETFDLGLCLQVLEHVPDPAAFAAKLLSSSTELIVSVPYDWKPGTTGHIHHHLKEETIREWFGRSPDFQMISTETNGVRRLICYFGPASRSGLKNTSPALN